MSNVQIDIIVPFPSFPLFYLLHNNNKYPFLNYLLDNYLSFISNRYIIKFII